MRSSVVTFDAVTYLDSSASQTLAVLLLHSVYCLEGANPLWVHNIKECELESGVIKENYTITFIRTQVCQQTEFG